MRIEFFQRQQKYVCQNIGIGVIVFDFIEIAITQSAQVKGSRNLNPCISLKSDDIKNPVFNMIYYTRNGFIFPRKKRIEGIMRINSAIIFAKAIKVSGET